MDFSKIDLDYLRTIPPVQKVAALLILLAIIGVGFYYYSFEPKELQIAQLEQKGHALDQQIQTLTLKIKHLDELVAANKQLEVEIAKKKERLPPQEEAVMLLKQLTDLGMRLGLDVRLWKPGKVSLDSTRLFVRMPVNVEVVGGYHTVAMFFDRVAQLPRIINVSDLKMGTPKFTEGRVEVKTVFGLTAFAAPTEKKAMKGKEK